MLYFGACDSVHRQSRALAQGVIIESGRFANKKEEAAGQWESANSQVGVSRRSTITQPLGEPR
jgi:hypothetical protein